jgi:hypothetical protein
VDQKNADAEGTTPVLLTSRHVVVAVEIGLLVRQPKEH